METKNSILKLCDSCEEADGTPALPGSALSERGRGRNKPPVRVFAAAAALALFLSGCESRDVSLQAELAGLREKIRKSEQERDLAVRDRSDAEKELARGSLLPVATLRDALGDALKPLEQSAASAFPGYRPAPPKAGRIFYLYEAAAPYRAPVELALHPISISALTPELPKIVFEARAGADGAWQMPSASMLRELQAEALARSTSVPFQQQAPVPPGRPQASAQPPAQPQGPPTSGGARVIEWGDSRGAGSARQPEQPTAPSAPRAPQQSGNTPRAAESYEIRFND